MYLQEIPRDILESVKVPTRYKYLAWFVVAILVSIGIFLSVKSDEWLWLARFGALIVLVSLLVEASGIIQNHIDKMIQIVAESTSEVVGMQVKRLPHMYGLSGSESDEQLNQIAQKEHAQRLANVSVIVANKISTDIRKTEFKIGCLGTLLWGFGDLVGKFL